MKVQGAGGATHLHMPQTKPKAPQGVATGAAQAPKVAAPQVAKKPQATPAAHGGVNLLA